MPYTFRNRLYLSRRKDSEEAQRQGSLDRNELSNDQPLLFSEDILLAPGLGEKSKFLQIRQHLEAKPYIARRVCAPRSYLPEPGNTTSNVQTPMDVFVGAEAK